MEDINEYILRSITERKAHLDLETRCIERGGPQNGGLSSYCKGLMAHVLNTSIPSGHKIHVCHACNNERCSNPFHLYWGTAKENRADQGIVLSAWERTVQKYGLEEAKSILKENSAKGAFKGGAAGKGRTLTEEHKRKISENRKGGRKKSTARVV